MMGRYGHMGMLRIAKKRDRQIVTDALERVDMVDFRHRQIGELSGGQKKRVFLARAIAQQGDVILLDEPFTGVDVKTEAKIISLLRGVTRGRQNDACLNAQSRIRHDILRLYGHGQRHRPGKRADRHHFYSREPGAGFLAAYCAMSHLTARKKALLLTMNAPFVAHRPSAVQREER